MISNLLEKRKNKKKSKAEKESFNSSILNLKKYIEGDKSCVNEIDVEHLSNIINPALILTYESKHWMNSDIVFCVIEKGNEIPFILVDLFSLSPKKSVILESINNVGKMTGYKERFSRRSHSLNMGTTNKALFYEIEIKRNFINWVKRI